MNGYIYTLFVNRTEMDDQNDDANTSFNRNHNFVNIIS